ncbi:MAG: CocE/NonD family hydrolase, partial [Streptosporangiaceae bacterium]
MLVGPWTHLDTVGKAGVAFAESLAWLDRHAGRRPGDAAAGHTARIWVGGAREWREITDWPPAGPDPKRWYLGAGGTLRPHRPGAGVQAARFRYDPADPTPSPGGAILALNAVVRDNRAVEQRPD